MRALQYASRLKGAPIGLKGAPHSSVNMRPLPIKILDLPLFNMATSLSLRRERFVRLIMRQMFLLNTNSRHSYVNVIVHEHHKMSVRHDVRTFNFYILCVKLPTLNSA